MPQLDNGLRERGGNGCGLLRIAEAARLLAALQFSLFFVLLHIVPLFVDALVITCACFLHSVFVELLYRAPLM